ncbi:PilZ domain-containing protein [Agaribacterium sp. ZY112]|uniref:PilZ domain-containing protein n=1 Tax=Agaribacterium sp. ZY112 TaxID=3233574 RepID=UPI0035258088
MSSELRRHERHPIERSLVVKNSLTNKSLGMLVNLSRDGLMLLGATQLNEGGVYQVQMEFPDQALLHLGLECLWLNDSTESDKSWAGFKIIDISPEGRSQLESYISQI